MLIGLSAKDWLAEYDRVIVRGESTSLALGTQVSMTYRFVLVSSHSRASAMASAGKGAERVWACYVGKEQRGRRSKALYCRIFEHGGANGNDDVREFAAFFGRGHDKVLYTPVGDVLFEKRVMLILPGDAPAALVDAAESAVFALLLLVGAAFIFVNMSPTGENLRFLK